MSKRRNVIKPCSLGNSYLQYPVRAVLFWYVSCWSCGVHGAWASILCGVVFVGGSQSIPILSCFNVHFLLKNGFVHCWEKNVVGSFLKVFLLGLLTDNLRLAEQK